MKAVVAENLTKVYPQGTKAVDGVSLELDEGEVFGFLGPNGAGKTTTVKLLNGMLSPTGGSCMVFGLDPCKDPVPVHQASGVITEHAQMYDSLTGIQNLEFFGAMFGMGGEEAHKRAMDLLERLELAGAKDRRLGAYSTGMRQRLSLARAMIHSPKILFLDEPTSGLDPESIMSVNTMIKRMAEDEGVTIFLCTHQLRYAQEICNSYGLIDEGSLLALGDIEKLRSMSLAGLTVTIKADRLPDGLPISMAGEGMYEANVRSEAEIPGIVKRIVDNGGNVYGVAARGLSLEEIYFDLIDRRKKGAEEAK